MAVSAEVPVDVVANGLVPEPRVIDEEKSVVLGLPAASTILLSTFTLIWPPDAMTPKATACRPLPTICWVTEKFEVVLAGDTCIIAVPVFFPPVDCPLQVNSLPLPEFAGLRFAQSLSAFPPHESPTAAARRPVFVVAFFHAPGLFGNQVKARLLVSAAFCADQVICSLLSDDSASATTIEYPGTAVLPVRSLILLKVAVVVVPCVDW